MGSLWMVIQVIFYLAVIIGLFFIIIKVMAKRNRMFQSGRSIKSLGGLVLGPNKSLQVVEIGSKLYVVGVGDNVTLLSQIDDAEEAEYIREHMLTGYAGDFGGVQTVKGWLERLRSGREAVQPEERATFKQIFEAKMGHIASRKKEVDQLFQDELREDRQKDK